MVRRLIFASSATHILNVQRLELLSLASRMLLVIYIDYGRNIYPASMGVSLKAVVSQRVPKHCGNDYNYTVTIINYVKEPLLQST